MALQNELTELVCLFHSTDRAHAAVEDLKQAGITPASIATFGGPNSAPDLVDKSKLSALGMPDKDYDHLKQGVRDGGTVVSVSAIGAKIAAVEAIFHKHSADKIDESTREHFDTPVKAAPLAAAAAVPAAVAAAKRPEPVAPVAAKLENDVRTAIPIVEEKLVVGKRTVDQGGVRVFRKVIEIPVEESISLREEHIVVDRHAVDRPATEADLAFGDRTIELTETAEEAVIAKNARVVGEVVVGKTASEHTEVVHDTVRKTEVEVEKIAPGTTAVDPTRTTR